MHAGSRFQFWWAARGPSAPFSPPSLPAFGGNLRWPGPAAGRHAVQITWPGGVQIAWPGAG